MAQGPKVRHFYEPLDSSIQFFSNRDKWWRSLANHKSPQKIRSQGKENHKRNIVFSDPVTGQPVN